MLSTKATTVSIGAIDRFRNWLSVRGRSEQTIKAYTTDLTIFIKETSPKPNKWKKYECPMEEFGELGMNWLQANRNRLSPKTTNRRLTSLRMFCVWAGWGDLFSDFSAPTPAKGQPHPLPEGIDGVHKLIDVATNEKQRALVALCGLMGLRIAEALAIKASNFDLQTMMLSVRGKGDKTRLVPVSEVAWEVLALPVAHSFVNGNAPVVGLKDRFARRIVTELGVRAGLERHISSHDLRATFATAVYNKSLDQRVVQELLGHSSGSTTEVYIGRSANQMRAAVEGL